ncbi:MAG: PP2C family serine/threonine-protein phosphatase [Pyrinomonadaceae bacterium]
MSFGKWRYARASVTGLAHLNQNTDCQDRFLCRTLETAAGEILIAVVADGAGSTSEGGRGAELACRSFAQQVENFLNSPNASLESLNEEFGRFWIDHFQKATATVAREDKKELREYATTLVGAVAGEHRTAFFQVGDGGAVFSASGESGSYLFGVEPMESEYVNMTDFLTDETAPNALRYALIEEAIEDLILFSDGIFAVAVDYQENRPHEPFLRPMIAPLRNGGASDGLNEKLETFLASPKLGEKTDDDKTIILASRALRAEGTAKK